MDGFVTGLRIAFLGGGGDYSAFTWSVLHMYKVIDRLYCCMEDAMTFSADERCEDVWNILYTYIDARIALSEKQASKYV